MAGSLRSPACTGQHAYRFPTTTPNAQAQLQTGNRALRQQLQALEAEAACRSGVGLQALTLGEREEAGLPSGQHGPVPTIAQAQQAGAPWERQFLP